jgi:hypothetical protein
MRLLASVVSLALVAGLSTAALAQGYGYDRGYRDGYTDQQPLSGPPDGASAYGQGWHAGQDDADDEDDAQRAWMLQDEARSKRETQEIGIPGEPKP